MTTRVKVEITQAHRPVVVEILGSDGLVARTATLHVLGEKLEEYVHSNQLLRVREMTSAESFAGGAPAV